MGKGKIQTYCKIFNLYNCVHGDNTIWIRDKWGKAGQIELNFRNVELWMPENHSGKHVQGELGSTSGAQDKAMADE